MDGDALELALGLYRAPIQRFALPGRPLPSDIDAVIQLAAGVQPKLRDAAASHGESEQTVLEAARFYLQQVLFQPDADAYRVLGLRPDSEPESIHRHYRWLQSWLHPDRCDDEWEALLATRVNWAWGHLRTDAARRRYAVADAALANEPVEADTYPEVSANAWIPAQAAAPGSWSKRIALGLSLGVCIALLVLGVTLRDASVPDDFAAPQTVPAGARGRSLVEAAARTMPRTSRPVQDVAATGEPGPSTQVPDDPPVSKSVPAAQDSATEPPPPSVVDAEMAQLPSPAISPPQVRLPLVADIRMRIATPIKPAQPPTELAEQSIRTDAASAPTLAAAKQSSNTRDEQPRIAPVNDEHGHPVAQPQRYAAKPLPARAEQRAASIPKSAESAPSKVISSQTMLTPVERQPAALAPDLAVRSEETRAKMDLARQRIGEVAAYLGNPRLQPPPVWNDVHGQVGAEQQRAALLQRSQSRTGGDFIVETTTWQMSRDAAALIADYHLLRGRNVFESGRIAMDMVWREQMWLITRVELSPGQ